MARFYLSATYSDLVEFRAEVYKTLRRMGHDAVAMEDYVASDHRPLSKCLRDIETCDVYIGIVAWRYGFIPPEADPPGTCITELEYRHAKTCGKPCLIFLVSPATPWPAQLRDGGNPGQSVCAFRDLLVSSHTVSFFETATQLALIVSIDVRRWEIGAGIANPVPSLEDQALPREFKVKNYLPGKRLTVAYPYWQAFLGYLICGFGLFMIGSNLYDLMFDLERVQVSTVKSGAIPYFLFFILVVWFVSRPCRITFDLQEKMVTLQGPGFWGKARPVAEGLELRLKERRSGWSASLRYGHLLIARTKPYPTRVEARERLVGFATALNYAMGMHTLKEV